MRRELILIVVIIVYSGYCNSSGVEGDSISLNGNFRFRAHFPRTVRFTDLRQHCGYADAAEKFLIALITILIDNINLITKYLPLISPPINPATQCIPGVHKYEGTCQRTNQS